jgi:endoglucanase
MEKEAHLMKSICTLVHYSSAEGFTFLSSAVFTATLIILLFHMASRSRVETGFIRVNQVGYELGTSGRAYLMAKTSAGGATFDLEDSSGKKIFSSAVGGALGLWGSFIVYALDFPASCVGKFTIEVRRPVTAVSPSFPIATPEKLYSQGISNALNFYQNERDGASFIKSPLRTAAGHLNDEHASVYDSPQFDSNDLILGNLVPTGATIDASGGWWDAGDYLKFVQTHSYTVALMLIGIRDFPEQMGASAGSSNFKGEAEFGLRWLQKMWDDDSRTLYYQVGIGTHFLNDPDLLSDHDIWRLPQVDDALGGTDPTLVFVRHRPVFQAGHAGSKISPNLAGRLAADFAGCYQVFRDAQPAFANHCLLSAEHIFDLADTSNVGALLTTAPFDFYSESEWRDDLELGATELYFALAKADSSVPAALPHRDAMFYLRTAAHWAHAYITGPNDASDTLNLGDVSGLAHFELFRAIGEAGHPGGLEVSQSDLTVDLRRELENAIMQSNTDPFGFGFPWDVFDTTTHGAGLSVMAREYALLTKSDAFDQYSRRWEANILGANAWGTSLIVGNGDTFPNCMQHQVANIVGSLHGRPAILGGALVEGPNSFAATGFVPGMRKCPPGGGDPFRKFDSNRAVYRDNQQSFSTVEPAIDLTAASFLMFSWRIARSPITLIPGGDISVAFDQPVVSKRNLQWPARHSRASRYSHRKTISPASN